jgi:hypothetical protein
VVAGVCRRKAGIWAQRPPGFGKVGQLPTVVDQVGHHLVQQAHNCHAFREQFFLFPLPFTVSMSANRAKALPPLHNLGVHRAARSEKSEAFTVA